MYCKLPGPIHYVQLGVKECVPGVMPLPQPKREDKTGFNAKNGSGSSSPPLREESEAYPRSPMSGVNVTKSFFGLNLGASDERDAHTAGDDSVWPDKARTMGGLTDSDLD